MPKNNLESNVEYMDDFGNNGVGNRKESKADAIKRDISQELHDVFINKDIGNSNQSYKLQLQLLKDFDSELDNIIEKIIELNKYIYDELNNLIEIGFFEEDIKDLKEIYEDDFANIMKKLFDDLSIIKDYINKEINKLKM